MKMSTMDLHSYFLTAKDSIIINHLEGKSCVYVNVKIDGKSVFVFETVIGTDEVDGAPTGDYLTRIKGEAVGFELTDAEGWDLDEFVSQTVSDFIDLHTLEGWHKHILA